MHSDENNRVNLTSSAPNWLGYLGLLPFIISSLVVWLPEYSKYAIKSLTVYAAVILTFIGGVHWGIALQHSHNQNQIENINKHFIFSVIPSLLAWFAVVFIKSHALLILVIGFILFWWFEKSFYQDTLPSWYARLRTHLTVVACLSILIGWFSTH